MTDKKPTSSTQASQEKSAKSSLPSAETTMKKTAVNETPKSKYSKNNPPKSHSPKSTSSKKIDHRPIGHRSRRKKIAYVFFAIVVLILLGAAAYGLWHVWRIQDSRIATAQQEQVSLSATVNKNAAQLQQELSEQQNQLALFIRQSTKEQQLLQQRLDAQLAKLNTLSGISRDGWMLEEARHLLRLANQRQLTGSNVSGIVGLLQAADDLLREIDLPNLFPIREKIQNDIVALKIAPSVDREGIYLQLNALINSVESLPPAPRSLSLQTKSDSEKNTSEKSDSLLLNQKEQKTFWNRITTSVSNAFGSLDNYVRIIPHDKALAPLLLSSQKAATQENLRLVLEQAQVALLREEAVVYTASIAKAIEWLHAHYSHYPEKENIANVLSELKTQSILTDLPSVASSLYTLSQYIDVQDKSISKKNNVEKEDKKTPHSDSSEIKELPSELEATK